MFFGDPFSRPEIVGAINEDLFRDVRSQAVESWQECVQWYNVTDRQPDNPALCEVLEPLTNLIMNLQVQGNRPEPYAIMYSVSARPIRPGNTQRGAGWHVDGHGKTSNFVVADCLPTEFLSRREDRRLTVARFLPHSSETIPLHLSDKSMERKGLEVYAPEPYQLAAFKGKIHRSPTNNSQADISRTWLRATILPSKKASRS
jgi:hypothetical protein